MSAQDHPFEALARRLGGRLIGARTLHGGVSALTTAVELQSPDGSTRKVVVRQPGGAYSERQVQVREYRLMEALSAAGLPVPRPILLDAAGEILGGPAWVMEFIDGAPDYGGEHLSEKLAHLGRSLASVHAVPVDETLRSLLPSRDEQVAAFLAGPREDLDGTIGEDVIRKGLAERPRPAPRNPPVLLHGDFWPGNVLWRDRRLVAVIDWEDAGFGDPLYDLAVSRLDMLWTYGTDALEPFTAAYARAAPQVDLTLLPMFELTAALRPAGQVSVWAAAAPMSGMTAQIMRERHALFRDRALEAYALLTR